MHRQTHRPTPRQPAAWLQGLVRQLQRRLRHGGSGRRPQRAPRIAATDDGLLPVAEEAADPDLPPRGSAWFDSSWQLQHGLAVTEHERLDSVCNELPLGWWLAWQSGPDANAVAALR
jgi:hypothetical protein